MDLRENRRNNAEVAQILSVHEKMVSGWWAEYGRIGPALFEPGTRRRRRGDQRKLTAERESELQRLITERLPERLRLSFVLWTKSAVSELIERRYGIKLPVRNRGAVRFLIYAGALDRAFVVRFCELLGVSTAGRTVYPILERLPVYSAEVFRQSAAAHRQQFTVYCLPALGNDPRSRKTRHLQSPPH